MHIKKQLNWIYWEEIHQSAITLILLVVKERQEKEDFMYYLRKKLHSNLVSAEIKIFQAQP